MSRRQCFRHYAFMPSRDRVYRRTETGYRAWASEKSGLPVAYRRILGIAESATQLQVICAQMAPYEDHQVAQWIDELETLGFVQCDSADAQLDLAYTTSALAAFATRSRVA